MDLLSTISKSVALEISSDQERKNACVVYRIVRICSLDYVKVCLLLNIRDISREAVSMLLREVADHTYSVTEIYFSEREERLALLLENPMEIPPFLEYLLDVQNCIVEIEKSEFYNSPVNLIDEVGEIDGSMSSLQLSIYTHL